MKLAIVFLSTFISISLVASDVVWDNNAFMSKEKQYKALLTYFEKTNETKADFMKKLIKKEMVIYIQNLI